MKSSRHAHADEDIIAILDLEFIEDTGITSNYLKKGGPVRTIETNGQPLTCYDTER